MLMKRRNDLAGVTLLLTAPRSDTCCAEWHNDTMIPSMASACCNSCFVTFTNEY